jgi:hypothetical protein
MHNIYAWELILLVLEAEERGPRSLRWKLRCKLMRLHMERRKKWAQKELQRRSDCSRTSSTSGGDKWRKKLVGPEYSSDNAGDGPKGKRRPKPTKEVMVDDELPLPKRDDELPLPKRDRDLMSAHTRRVEQQSSEGTHTRIIPTRQQFRKKLAQFRTTHWNPNEADMEQYIQQHPFTDESEDSEYQHTDIYAGYRQSAGDTVEEDSFGDELLFTIEALESEENVSEQGKVDLRPSLISIFDGGDNLRWASDQTSTE